MRLTRSLSLVAMFVVPFYPGTFSLLKPPLIYTMAQATNDTVPKSLSRVALAWLSFSVPRKELDQKNTVHRQKKHLVVGQMFVSPGERCLHLTASCQHWANLTELRASEPLCGCRVAMLRDFGRHMRVCEHDKCGRTRILCIDVQREGAKPRPDLASRLFCSVPLHKICYGIRASGLVPENGSPHPQAGVRNRCADDYA